MALRNAFLPQRSALLESFVPGLSQFARQTHPLQDLTEVKTAYYYHITGLLPHSEERM